MAFRGIFTRPEQDAESHFHEGSSPQRLKPDPFSTPHVRAEARTLQGNELFRSL